jgi:hypothetical protein
MVRAGDKCMEMAICKAEYELCREFEVVDYVLLEFRGESKESERRGRRGGNFRRGSCGDARKECSYVAPWCFRWHFV